MSAKAKAMIDLGRATADYEIASAKAAQLGQEAIAAWRAYKEADEARGRALARQREAFNVAQREFAAHASSTPEHDAEAWNVAEEIALYEQALKEGRGQ